MLQFKDLELDGLSQDDQIRKVREALKNGKFGIFEDEDFAKWAHDNRERILEMANAGELED